MSQKSRWGWIKNHGLYQKYISTYLSKTIGVWVNVKRGCGSFVQHMGHRKIIKLKY